MVILTIFYFWELSTSTLPVREKIIDIKNAIAYLKNAIINLPMYLGGELTANMIKNNNKNAVERLLALGVSEFYGIDILPHLIRWGIPITWAHTKLL
jgi:hypothetical protein